MAKVTDAAEARLEQAIAALGQSLSQTRPPAPIPAADVPQKPIVVASAPSPAPTGGPRIDVVAVVNAATRAALAQRSADEQTSAAAFALPPEADPAPKPAAPTESAVATPSSSPPRTGSSAPTTTTPPPAVEIAPKAVAVPPSVRVAQPMTAPLNTSSAPPQSARSGEGPPIDKQLVSEQPPMVAAAEPAASVPLQAPAAAMFSPPAPVASATIASSPASQPRAPVPAPVLSISPAIVDMVAPSHGTTPPVAPAQGVQTLEDTVARLLRPMLRQWLDDNMPRIVEKAFKEELAAHDAPARPQSKPN